MAHFARSLNNCKKKLQIYVAYSITRPGKLDLILSEYGYSRALYLQPAERLVIKAKNTLLFKIIFINYALYCSEQVTLLGALIRLLQVPEFLLIELIQLSLSVDGLRA